MFSCAKNNESSTLLTIFVNFKCYTLETFKYICRQNLFYIMASNTFPTEDKIEYNIGVRHPAKFYQIFYFKKIRKGVEVLATRTGESFHSFFVFEDDYDFIINPIKGKRLDENNRIFCDGDVNVVNIFNSYGNLVLGWRPRCIITLLVPIGSWIGYDEDVLEFNYNEDEIEKYLKEQQIEKYKEEIKAAGLKKALRQVAKQRLIEEGILFDEEHKRPYIPKEVVGFVYMRDGGRCRECGCTKDLHIDHIIPLSKGGSSEPENLQILCKKCNLKHGNRMK